MTPQEKERLRQQRITDRNVGFEPLVSAPVAVLASLALPGLGQILSRQIQRGLLIFGAFATSLAIFYWRVLDLGHLAEPGPAQALRALQRRPGFFLAVAAIMALIWLISAWDAFRCAQRRKGPTMGMFLLIILGYFILGWQIAEINLVDLVRKAPDAIPPLSKILWPWEAAIVYEERALTAGAEVVTGEGAVAPERKESESGKPYLRVDPNVGTLSVQDAQGRSVPGTRVTISGSGYAPNTLTDIWWIDTIGNEFRPREGGQYLTAVTDSTGAFSVQMTMPYRIEMTSSSGTLKHRVEARQVSQYGPPKPSDALKLIIGRMVETIMMGMMATFFGILFSIPVSFLAARNIMAGNGFTMAVYFLTRTVLNIIRSIEPLIWALIAVVWVGLGPFAGIVALTLHSIAALGKLYSEAIEGIDKGPIEAIQATGANKLQTILYGVIPQMITPFISFSIYRWDINVRMSTVIGLVGGGGIGFLLVQYIRLLDYRSAGIAVWFIAITVAILDYVSAEIRNRLM